MCWTVSEHRSCSSRDEFVVETAVSLGEQIRETYLHSSSLDQCQDSGKSPIDELHTDSSSSLQDDDVRRSSIHSTLIVYHEKIRTSSVFIHDISFISPYALLFFGKTQSADADVLVDQWIPMHIDEPTKELINDLKEKFNYLLERKAAKKNVVVDNEEHLIGMIIHLITKQDRNLLLQRKLIDEQTEKEAKDEDWDAELSLR